MEGTARVAVTGVTGEGTHTRHQQMGAGEGGRCKGRSPGFWQNLAALPRQQPWMTDGPW